MGLYLMLVAIQTFELCVQKTVSRELSDEDTRAFVIETIFNRLCFTLRPVLFFLTITHRYKVSLDEDEAARNKKSSDADENLKEEEEMEEQPPGSAQNEVI